jgi:hypothetical protein
MAAVQEGAGAGAGAQDASAHGVQSPSLADTHVGDDIADLRRTVAELKQIIQQQQATLQQMQQQPRFAEQGPAPAPAASTSSRSGASVSAAPSGWQPALSPFEAQAAMIMSDRRLMGQYDARYHSTKRCASRHAATTPFPPPGWPCTGRPWVLSACLGSSSPHALPPEAPRAFSCWMHL